MPDPGILQMHRQLAALALVALLVTACSGGDDGTADAPVTTLPAAVTTAALLPPAPELTSFTYRSVTDITITEPADSTTFYSVKTGTFVASDRHYVHSTLELGGTAQPDVEVIAIGEDIYVRTDGAWAPASIGDPVVADAVGGLTSLNSDLVPNQINPYLGNFAATDEVLAGGPARRYDMGRPEFDRLTDLSGVAYFEGPVEASDELRFSVWRDERLGSIVKVELEVKGPASVLGPGVSSRLSADAGVSFLVTVELSDINTPGLSVEAPPLGP